MGARSWAFALGLGCLVPVCGCGQKGMETPAKASTARKAVPVTVAPLERRAVERTVEAVGTLKGWEDVNVGTKKEGRVLKVFHDMGDRVKPGELLVALDPVDADLEIRRAERQFQAELAKLGLKELPRGEFDVASIPAVVQARVALERARQNLARERSLNRRNAGTAQDLQNAENDLQGAEAALANAILTANATLASARASLAAVDVSRQARIDREIRAPIPSMRPEKVTDELSYAVAKRMVSEGQMIKANDAVFELVIEKPLRLWTNVPERYSVDVQVGQPVRVAASSHPGTVFEGKVSRINPSIDPVSRTFQVEVAVPNNRGLLRAGGFAEASILTNRADKASVVPLEAVVKFAGVTKLFVVEGGKARAINVETGLEGHGWVEVIGKLPAEAQVVTTGQTQLADGTEVAIRTPEAAPASEAPKSEVSKAEAPGPQVH